MDIIIDRKGAPHVCVVCAGDVLQGEWRKAYRLVKDWQAALKTWRLGVDAEGALLTWLLQIRNMREWLWYQGILANRDRLTWRDLAGIFTEVTGKRTGAEAIEKRTNAIYTSAVTEPMPPPNRRRRS